MCEKKYWFGLPANLVFFHCDWVVVIVVVVVIYQILIQISISNHQESSTNSTISL
mgnify:CR=1 FL=1